MATLSTPTASSDDDAQKHGLPVSESDFKRTATSFAAGSVALQGRRHGDLARRLGIDILSGVHLPGTILPNEIASSSSFNLSRSAYREAIRILAAKGLVESRPKTGTRVTARSHWILLDPDVLRWMFETEPSIEFVRSLFELRLIIEPAAAELAALRRSERDVENMRQALAIMKAETLATEAGQRADVEFHHALLQATRNEALASLSSSIEAAVIWTTHYKVLRNVALKDPIPNHERVLEAIASADLGAARWCTEALIRTAQEDTLRDPQSMTPEIVSDPICGAYD